MGNRVDGGNGSPRKRRPIASITQSAAAPASTIAGGDAIGANAARPVLHATAPPCTMSQDRGRTPFNWPPQVRGRRGQLWRGAPPEGTLCPICGKPMIRQNWHVRRPSRDHIRPRELGGDDAPDNKRLMCQHCNSLRAFAGHCLGALACARAVADENPYAVLQILKSWRLGK